MAQSDSAGPSGGLLSIAALPVFSVFFLWGFGTGALWMVRPLYAYSFEGSIFLVGLVSAFSAAPRMFGAPFAGALADRIGRKPVVAAGAVLHGAALAAQAYTNSYPPFLALELISGFGVAVWVTGSSVLLADFTRVANRGRGVALRNTSMRIGILSGPAAGGLVADMFGLASVFLFIAVTKVVIVVIVIGWVRETHSRQQTLAAHPLPPSQSTRLLPDLALFRTRDFMALGLITLALGLVTQGPGAFRTFFPVQAGAAGLSVTDVGNLISASGIAAMLVSLPVGALVDWRGRKPVLVVGLSIIGLSLFLVAGMTGLLIALAAALAFGVGEAVGSNTVQTYAMDLAPEHRRGYFLGTWQATMNLGQLIGPLVVGALAVPLGIPLAFVIIGCLILATGVATALVARETVA